MVYIRYKMGENILVILHIYKARAIYPLFLMIKTTYILLIILLDRSPCPEGVRILGRWCSIPCTEAQETLDSVPIWLCLL